jgi:UDP-3-O-[3-hydroxymyristoyl] glucosamine N-acyltransferase
MADSRFFQNNGPIFLREIIEITGASISKPVDLDAKIEDVASLELANSKHLSFLINNKYIEAFKSSKAGFCFVHEKFTAHAPDSMVVLVHSNPYKAYALVAGRFYKEKSNIGEIASSAFIAKTAKIGKNCNIGHNVVIEEDVVIGDNTRIDHNTVIKRSVVIGNDCKIASNVTVSHSVIGNNVVIYPGARIGQDGFGFASDHTGHLKVPQLGIVQIGSFVEIGANTTIDRGSAQNTVIEDMCQIDNLVQLGHNVHLGKACVIVAQVGIAGSTKLGDFVVLGGQVGLAGHLNIGNQVQVAAQSGVAQDVADKQIMGGSPAVPIRQWHRQNFCLQKLVNKDKAE